MDRRWVVEVLGTRSGSGLLLADRLVLTAAHLLFAASGRVPADERVAGEVGVRLAGDGDRYAARCVWARYEGPDRGLDAALLEITSPDWPLVAVEAVRAGRLAGSAEVRVHAFGFPDAAVRAGVAELSPVTGVVHTGSGAQSGRPEIVVAGEPARGSGGESLWAGLSGGPVFAAPGGVTSNVLLGVIVGDPAEFASRRLRMIPAPAVLADSVAAAITTRHCGSLAVISFPVPGLPAPPGMRFSLPPDTAAFTGRGEELDRITAAVAGAVGGGGVVAVGAIDGMPGVGKTALAVRVAHELSARFPDRQLFIDLHAHTPGRQPVAPEDALAGLLTADGVDPRFLPGELDERAGMWRDRMAGQRALLVLDNAASSIQVAPLLPGSGNCLVLVTSRRHLGDLPGVVTPVLLDVLPAERGEEMFTRLAPGGVVDRAGVAEVVRLAGFLPLAVSLLAHVFARHPSWTLADLAEETRDSLLTLTAEHDTIAAAFEVSYRHLDPALRRFFDLLGLHPGTTTDSYAAAALAGVSPGEAGGLLDALNGEGLLTESRHRRYGMHDLLRRYARDHAAADPGGKQALGGLLDYYQHTAALAQNRLARQTRPYPPLPAPAAPAAAPVLEDAGQALAWVRAERDSLLACLDQATQAGHHTRVTALTAALAELLRRDGPWTEAITRHVTAAQSAGHLGDRQGQANALNNLGKVRELRGDYPGAAEDVERALAIYRDLGDRQGQANALNNLGKVRELRGDYPGAAEDVERALAIYRDLGDRLGEAGALTELGIVRSAAGDWLGATADLERALAISRDLGDRLGQANALLRLGNVRQLTSDYPAATADLERALAISRDLGDRLGQANALLYLGAVRHQTGDYPGTAGDAEQALAIYRDLGNRQGQANALFLLGSVQRGTGDYPGAAADLEQALGLYRDIGDRQGQANALSFLGDIRRGTGDYPGAAADLEQALGLYRDLGSQSGQAGALLYLGAVRRGTGDYPGAAADLEQALGLYRDLGDRLGQAGVLNETGRLHQVTGEPAEAEACHQQALELARAIGSALHEARALAGLGRCAAVGSHAMRAEAMLRQAHEIFQRIGAADAPSVLAELDAFTRQKPPSKPLFCISGLAQTASSVRYEIGLMGMRIRRQVRLLAFASLVCSALLAGCTSSSQPSGNVVGGIRVKGGTATIALTPTDSQFNYIFPLLNFNNDTFANVAYSQYLMWRPLYWFGSPGHVGLNDEESLADPASVTTSSGKTIATIQLKPYRWSDGEPVTSRDVQFWINLLQADKDIFWGYKPGEFPDNLTSLKILSPSRFSLTFDHLYSADWLYNQLGLIIPLPEHAWDKISASGPVGNYDMTPAGAKAVGNFLLAQNKALSAYATNPLWQVVDGPWKLTSYAPSTGDATYIRNPRYSGPATGSLHAIRIISYTSDAAEFNQLLSVGGVDYGYVPYNDAAEVSRVSADGYTVRAWPAWGINYVFLNFASPQAGTMLRQLYIRQAMQHLINQAGYISSFLEGYAYPTYGPVPLQPASEFVSSQQTQNPYPYDPSVATSLLRAHGWHIASGGTDTCVRPGSGASQCGAGIPSGAKLSFSFQYASGTQADTEEVASLQSSFAQAGIVVTLNGAPFATVVGDMTPGCVKPNCWQLAYVGESWLFDPGYNEPDGAILFGSNGPSNLGSYSDPRADALISQLGAGGIPALYAYQDYVAKQLPGLWMPQTDTQISAVTGKLRGVYPQDPLDNIYPENWYFVK